MKQLNSHHSDIHQSRFLGLQCAIKWIRNLHWLYQIKDSHSLWSPHLALKWLQITVIVLFADGCNYSGLYCDTGKLTVDRDKTLYVLTTDILFCRPLEPFIWHCTFSIYCIVALHFRYAFLFLACYLYLNL